MVPFRSTAMMISGELSTRRCKYLGSSGSINSCASIIQPGAGRYRAGQPGSACWARAELGEHHVVAHLLKSHFHRHPDANFVRLDPDQVGNEPGPLVELHYHYRVGHFVGKARMIDLV